MLGLSSIVMLSLGLFKVFWLVMGTMALDSGPLPKIYVIDLILAPAYLAAAATAWKWPWICEAVAALTLIAILVQIVPAAVSPFQKFLSLDYAFIIAANVAFIAKLSLRQQNPHYPQEASHDHR